jgi:hypothetical protein
MLWEIEQNGFLRFRCRVGHALTAKYLGAEQRHAVEAALREALRALEKSASLYREWLAALRIPDTFYHASSRIALRISTAMRRYCATSYCGLIPIKPLIPYILFNPLNSRPNLTR